MGLYFKQLLDEVFVISRRIKVEVRVISRSRRLSLITLTDTLIILDITKTESLSYYALNETKWKSCFCFFTKGKQHKARKLDMITRDLECRWRDYCSYNNQSVHALWFVNQLCFIVPLNSWKIRASSVLYLAVRLWARDFYEVISAESTITSEKSRANNIIVLV